MDTIHEASLFQTDFQVAVSLVVAVFLSKYVGIG